jgi:hypothetical protein
MPNRPELIIGYHFHSFPISGTCSACRAEMPQPEPTLILSNPEDLIRWYSSQFSLHLDQEHKAH